MIKAYVGDNFSLMGLDISLVMSGGDGYGSLPRRILRFNAEGHHIWEEMGDPTMVTKPTFRLGHEEARALLDALLHHYEGASDMHTQRVDYLHERGRVDKLFDSLIKIAEAKSNATIGP